MLVAIKQHVSSTHGAFGHECIPDEYRQSIIFIGMMNELAVTDYPHRSDEPNLQKPAIIRDYAGRCGPGYLVFVGPGSEVLEC